MKVLLLLLLLCVSGHASAQTFPLMFEAIADTGRFSGPPTADVLAVGSTQTLGTATAADAAVHPAGLIRGPRSDVTVAVGAGRLWRETFMRTSTLGSFPTVFAAAAVRRRVWAAGGFYDGSARRRHRLTTDERLVSQVSSPGGAVFQRVSGKTNLSETVDVSRLGGSAAVAPFGGWLAIGGSAEVIRIEIDTRSRSDLEVLSIIRPQPPVTSHARETIAFVADEWNTAFTLDAEVQPARAVTISILRRWTPDVASTLAGDIRYIETDYFTSFDQQATLHVPDLFSVGVTLTIAATKVGAEVARIDYGVFDRDALNAIGGYVLEPAGAALEPRAGVRHELSLGSSRRLALSGGIRREGIHALSSNIASPFVPEPRQHTWLSGGAAFETPRLTVSVAAGAARNERRVIVSFGIRQT